MDAGKNARIFNALISIYVIAPLPLGSNRPWAWWTLAGCSFLLLAVWAFAWMGGKMPLSSALRGRVPVAAVSLLLVVVIWIFCQTIPLPSNWVAVLSPQNFKVYQEARAVIPAEGLSMPLSLDNDATFAAGVRSLFYLAMFLLLLQCLDSRRRLKVFLLRNSNIRFFSGHLRKLCGTFRNSLPFCRARCRDGYFRQP